MLLVGLEELLNTSQHQVTKQNLKAHDMLADEIGPASVSRPFAEDMIRGALRAGAQAGARAREEHSVGT